MWCVVSVYVSRAVRLAQLRAQPFAQLHLYIGYSGAATRGSVGAAEIITGLFVTIL